MKKLLVVLMALLFCVGVTACGKQKDPNAYSMIDGFNITTFDYVYNNKSSNGDYTSNFIEGLLTQEQHGYLVAGMAEKWEHNEDYSTWSFTIREGAQWVTSSGEYYADVKAEDFVTGMKHAVESKSQTLGLVKGLIKGLSNYVEGTATWDEVGIKVEGNVLTYELTQPCSYFDGMTTYSILFPINGDFLASKGSDFGKVEPDSILYNGCYVCKSVVAGQEVKFVKNQNYWDAENVFVTACTVTYTDNSDPAQGFNMFVNGEVTAASINSSLPDVVKKANEKYADNQYKTLTTATSYWGAFNYNRRSFTLFNDTNVATTNKTEKQIEDTKKAILNKYFRLAIYAAYSTKATQSITKGDERALDAARNTLIPYNFQTLSDGTLYGDILTQYVIEEEPMFEGINLNDGQDAWYNPELAAKFMAKAVEELGDTVDWPIILDVPNDATSTNRTNITLAFKDTIEKALAGYVEVNPVMLSNSDEYYYAFYDVTKGEENSIDLSFGAGWGPDYGDPLTYIHCFDAREGDMLAYSGMNTELLGEDASDLAVKETIGLEEIKDLIDDAAALGGDDRIKAFARIEAKLLTGGILRPYSTSGANLVVSKVVPFSGAYGMYGQASYNTVPYFKYMKLQEEPVTAADYYAAKEAWLKGE